MEEENMKLKINNKKIIEMLNEFFEKENYYIIKNDKYIVEFLKFGKRYYIKINKFDSIEFDEYELKVVIHSAVRNFYEYYIEMNKEEI